jgi:hypothetical protein
MTDVIVSNMVSNIFQKVKNESIPLKEYYYIHKKRPYNSRKVQKTYQLKENLNFTTYCKKKAKAEIMKFLE